MIYVRGARSKIAHELNELVPITGIARDEDMPTDKHRYLFCSGLVRHKPQQEQSEAEICEGFRVNFWQVWEDCEAIFAHNDKARVCIIGSESAYNREAFDKVYAAAKFRLHDYVKRKVLRPGQQLVCISPGVIEDCGMAIRHSNPEKQAERRRQHPQRRFMRAKELAKLIHYVLCVDDGYLNNIIIRMNGGEHTVSRRLHV